MAVPHFGSDDLLAVYTVHQAHDGGVFPHNGPDAFQRTGQGTVLQRHHQKVHVRGLRRGPDLRAVDGPVDGAALFLQTLSAPALGDDPQLQVLPAGKAPDDIGTHGSGSQNCNRTDLHTVFSPFRIFCTPARSLTK